MNENKVYLGDGVYAEYESGVEWPRVKLTTENGTEITNVIFLEEDVIGELIEFWRVKTS